MQEPGFDITSGALSKVHAFMDDDSDLGFKDVGQIVDRLHQLELLTKKTSWNSHGPTMLGKRPAWQGPASKIKAQAGMDRRHVISSSSLGLAVERAIQPALNTTLAAEYVEDIRGFLVDHGVANLSPTATVQDAGRQAWVLLANHAGNLWMGPSDPNRVRGFIRAPLLDHAESLKLEKDDLIPLAKALGPAAEAAGPGMQRHAPKGKWAQIIQELTAVLMQNAVMTQQGAMVPRLGAAAALEHFAKSADLDLPHTQQHDYVSDGGDEEYLTEIIEIYLELEKATIEIFYEGGPLDRFMELDASGELAKTKS